MGDGSDKAGATAANATPTDTPAELAGLISSWNHLPGNVRFAIRALAKPERPV